MPENLSTPALEVLQRALERRDELNLAFARSLARDWPQLAASKDLRQPLPLHQLSRVLLRRLVDDSQRVLLVVLDGCDLSTLLELLDTLGDDGNLGLTLPPVRTGSLRDDLQQAVAYRANRPARVRHRASNLPEILNVGKGSLDRMRKVGSSDFDHFQPTAGENCRTGAVASFSMQDNARPRSSRANAQDCSLTR